MPAAAVAIVEPIKACARAPMKLREGAAGDTGRAGGAAVAASSGPGRVAGAPEGETGIGGAAGAAVGSDTSFDPFDGGVPLPVLPASSSLNAMYFFLAVRWDR